jgi:peptidoglycan/LPS O-acetylase OafA/YrhL
MKFIRSEKPAFQSKATLRQPDRATARIAALMRLAEPTASVVLLLGVVLVPNLALAQGPGGTIFGSDDQTVGAGIKAAAKYARVALFFLGLFFFMWAAKNYGSEKPWGKQIGGGIGCWGFAAFAALFYSWSQGEEVDFDSDLGS